MSVGWWLMLLYITCFRISRSIWVEANPYLYRHLFGSYCNWFSCCLGIWLVEWIYHIWNEHFRFSGLFHKQYFNANFRIVHLYFLRIYCRYQRCGRWSKIIVSLPFRKNVCCNHQMDCTCMYCSNFSYFYFIRSRFIYNLITIYFLPVYKNIYRQNFYAKCYRIIAQLSWQMLTYTV